MMASLNGYEDIMNGYEEEVGINGYYVPSDEEEEEAVVFTRSKVRNTLVLITVQCVTFSNILWG